MIRFVLADPSGNSFIDLSTLRLHMQLNNLDGAKALDFPQHSISSWFRRIRILVCGTVVEDIHFSGRLAQQLELMRPPARNWSDSIMGLGNSETDVVTLTGGGFVLRSRWASATGIGTDSSVQTRVAISAASLGQAASSARTTGYRGFIPSSSNWSSPMR
jgi:hypothetical protein